MGQYFHITYGHPPSHFKPSLDYAGHLMQSESEVSQSCLTLCDLMNCSPPGSSVHGIFQARVLEWGAIVLSMQSSSGTHRVFVTVLRRKWQPTPVLLALKIPWTEELGAGYYPWGLKESGTTERLHFTSLHLTEDRCHRQIRII